MRLNVKSPLQRILSVLLCMALLMSFSSPAWAAETTDTTTQTGSSGLSGLSDTVEYVSLPITIRDFAADGMLFEFNQTDKSAQDYVSKTFSFDTESLNSGYTWSSNSNLGYRIRTYATHGATLPSSHTWWYCVICNSDGTIKKILPYGGYDKTADYAANMTSGCFAVWMWIGSGDGSADDLAAKEAYNNFYNWVPEDNRYGCTISYSTSSGMMTIKTKYGYIEYNGTKYIVGDNNAFTLQRTDGSDYVNNLQTSDSIPGTELISNTTGGTTPPDPVTVTLNSGATQEVYGANLRTNLVTATLDGNKKPVYTQYTVAYLADLLQTLLQVPYSVKVDGETYYPVYYPLGTKLFDMNNNYVGTGESAKKDLADVFRACINGGPGTYADAKERFDEGKLSNPADVDTYYEAAYYLLHSLWRDSASEAISPGSDGYGWSTWNYDKINLIQTTNANGEKCYVFNSGYDNVKYDHYLKKNETIIGSGAIYNTQIETITPAQHKAGDGTYTGGIVYSNGVILPNARFDPLGQSGTGLVFGYGQNAGTYCELVGSYPDRGELFYPTTNYHYTLEGHAKFIYYKEANQYFTFTGDDDVYLYINGTRVMDLGGAHSIAQVQINLNDVAELCGLADGMTYDFDFYYMERHGTAANFGIETNIQIVDPSMLTTKIGYQGGESTGYNGYVNPYLPVVYEFGLENDGEVSIQNLTFSDPTIGVSLTKDLISLNDLTKLEDLSVTLYDGDGTVKSSVAAGLLTEDTLKAYLTEGLAVGEKIVIHGFSYKISDDEWDRRTLADNSMSNWYFSNIIYTTATANGENSSTKGLTGTASWVVQKLQAEKMGPLYITKQLGENASHTLLDGIYTMQVLLNGKPLPVGTEYTIGTETRTVEIAGQILVGVGQTAEIEGIAYGTAFRVSELISEADRDVYRVTYQAINATADENGVTGTITEGAEATAIAINHAKSGNLVETDKWVTATDDPNEFVLTLEAYAKGQIEQITVTKPADIILVLDHSGSMRTPAGASKVLYSRLYENNTLVREGEPYDGTASALTKDQLNSDKGQHRGYYVAWSTTSYTWFVMEYDAANALWIGYSVPSTESIVNPTGWTEHTLTQSWSYDNLPGQLVYYKSQYAVLYDAMLEFVGDLKASGVEHNVAIVGFAGATSDGTRLYVGSSGENNGGYKTYQSQLYHANTTQARRDDLYQMAMKNVQNSTEYSELLNNIELIETNYSFTCPTAGLQLANEVFAANAVDLAERDRIVVLFTDGIPNQMLEKSEGTGTVSQDDIYDEIVKKACETKTTYGAQVYSICTTTVTGSKDFLNYSSSNYPNASSYTTPGTKESEQYFHEITSFEALNSAFTTISQSTTSTSVTLDETAILKEVLTDYFVLNPDADVDVQIYTADYEGDGKFAAPVLKTEADGFSYTLSSSDGSDRLDTIDVTGYDYHDEYLSEMLHKKEDGSVTYGSKLIVKVRIRTRDGFWGGNNVPTNEGKTGIYDQNEVPTEGFPMPEVNVPITVDVVAKDKTIYYGGNVTGKDLIESVTAGGVEVIIKDDGTFAPAEDWMNDYADLSWTAESTKPGDSANNLNFGDYTFEVQMNPKYDGSENRQDNPSNIAGNIDGGAVETNPSAETTKTDADIGHVYILVPQITFKDSVTDFGTSADGYNYTGSDYVTTEWVNMQTNLPEGVVVPDPDQTTKPTLTLTYTPETDVFVEDTKVEVSITSSNSDGDISSVTEFKWETCEDPLHGECGSIGSHKASEADKHEFWIHVNLWILPDTVVIDYGLPVDIDPLTNDPTFSGIRPTLVGIGKDAVISCAGEFGVAHVNGELVRYILNIGNGMEMFKEETFTYRVRYTVGEKSRTVDSTITVIPATTIYYEDSFLTYKVYDFASNAEVTNSEDSKYSNNKWSATNPDAATSGQAQDRPGKYSLPKVDANNIYGYDGAYTSMATYSMNSSMVVTVDSDAYATAEFNFCGTGFDIVSLTSGDTGTIVVTVYDKAAYAAYLADSTGVAEPIPVTTLMVDTYYGYTYGDSDKDGDNEWYVDQNASSTLYQVPVLKVELPSYGQYTAIITASYVEFLDHKAPSAVNGEYTFYLDAIRIYDPANDGKNNTTIENAYKADGEGWPEYFELRNLIISKNDFDSLGDSNDEVGGIVFIDGNSALTDDNASAGDANSDEEVEKDVVTDKSPAISDYINYGPNNELYLAPGQAVSFKLNGANVENIHLALKSVGNSAEILVYGVDAEGKVTYALGNAAIPAEINTATDLYYDITKLNGQTVVILNKDSSAAILSITNIKMTYGEDPSGITTASTFTVSRSSAAAALASFSSTEGIEDTETPIESKFPVEPVEFKTFEPGVTNAKVFAGKYSVIG